MGCDRAISGWVYKWVKGKAPALRSTFSKAKISELFGLSRAKKAGATASTSETNASVEMIEKTFTKAEMKELLASKANDNFSSINDNGICMSKGKVVNGESIGVGRVSSSVVGRASYSSVKSKSYNSQTPADKKIDVLKKKSVESGDHKLLPGECEVGTYGELIARGEKWDNLTPDHMPSAAYMKKHFGVNKKDGVAMNMEHPHPGTGGRHRQSRTYGKPATDNPLRTEVYLDVSNRIDIYKKEGLYGSKVRKGLLNVIEENRKRFPEEFKKGK